MKFSNVVLFGIIISFIIYFTKINNWFQLELWWILVAIGIFCILKFLEIHQKNKKERNFINKVRGFE